MSFPARAPRTLSFPCLLVAVARQILIAGAAVAGVLAIAGCNGTGPGYGRYGSNTNGNAPANNGAPPGGPVAAADGQDRPGQPAMRSPVNAPPTAMLSPFAPDTPDVPPPTALRNRQQPDTPAGVSATPLAPPRDTSVRDARLGQGVDPDAVASPSERKRAQKAEIEALLNEAMQAPLSPPTRAAVALGASEKAVAPLVDSLAAIDGAQQVIVENLRNLETPGYKGSRTAVGDGKDAARQLDVGDGELQPTHRMLDVAVQGDGFLQVQVYTPDKPESSVGFTRNGHLFMNRKGEVVVGESEGFKLIPPLLLPPGTTKLTIDAAGRVAAARDTADSPAPAGVGRVHLARFTDPTALRPLGGGIYAESPASGPAVESPAGEKGAGTVLQGFLEGSNVDLVRERMRLHFLQTWRAGLIGAMEALPYTPPAAAARRSASRSPAAGE